MQEWPAQDQDQARAASNSSSNLEDWNFLFDSSWCPELFDTAFLNTGDAFTSEKAFDLGWDTDVDDHTALHSTQNLFSSGQTVQNHTTPTSVIEAGSTNSSATFTPETTSSVQPVQAESGLLAESSLRASAQRESSSSSRQSRKRPTSSPEPEGDGHAKRQRNTEAARRYRQRKVDRLTELEEALASMTKERDDLKLKLARAETEVDVLRGMVGRKSS